MANTVNNTLNIVGDTIEQLFGKRDKPASINTNASTGQTCLEKVGMEARFEHITRNDWRRNDIEYTRALVLSEYAIQNEFKISSSDEPIVRNRGGLETIAERYARQEQKKLDDAAKATAKAEKKRKKKEEKTKKESEKIIGTNSKEDTKPTAPVEITKETKSYMAGLENGLIKNNLRTQWG